MTSYEATYRKLAVERSRRLKAQRSDRLLQHPAICIIFPPFSSKLLCSPSQFEAWPWRGPVYGEMVFRAETK